MAIIERNREERPKIDLAGPDGNAFALMGYASNFGRQLGKSKEEINEIIQEMKSGDYDNLIETFDKYFGDFVDLVKP